MGATYKPVGGVESVALYPADAVTTALFSSEGCEVELSGTPIEVPLLEDASQYEESSELRHGVITISHKLLLVADKDNAAEWLSDDFIEQASFEGFIAIVSLCDGRRTLVGYSSHLGSEQPLRLEKIISSSGKSLSESPSVTLQLISHDTEFSPIIL
jgi:hypothetical protein